MSLLNSEQNEKPDTAENADLKQDADDILSDENQGGDQEEKKQDIDEQKRKSDKYRRKRERKRAKAQQKRNSESMASKNETQLTVAQAVAEHILIKKEDEMEQEQAHLEEEKKE